MITGKKGIELALIALILSLAIPTTASVSIFASTEEEKNDIDIQEQGDDDNDAKALKMAVKEGGKTNKVQGFKLLPDHVLVIEPNKKVEVTEDLESGQTFDRALITDNKDKEKKVKITSQGVVDFKGYKEGVYTLDVIIKDGDKKIAYEAIVVVGEDNESNRDKGNREVTRVNKDITINKKIIKIDKDLADCGKGTEFNEETKKCEIIKKKPPKPDPKPIQCNPPNKLVNGKCVGPNGQPLPPCKPGQTKDCTPTPTKTPIPPAGGGATPIPPIGGGGLGGVPVPCPPGKFSSTDTCVRLPSGLIVPIVGPQLPDIIPTDDPEDQRAIATPTPTPTPPTDTAKPAPPDGPACTTADGKPGRLDTGLGRCNPIDAGTAGSAGTGTATPTPTPPTPPDQRTGAPPIAALSPTPAPPETEPIEPTEPETPPTDTGEPIPDPVPTDPSDCPSGRILESFPPKCAPVEPEPIPDPCPEGGPPPCEEPTPIPDPDTTEPPIPTEEPGPGEETLPPDPGTREDVRPEPGAETTEEPAPDIEPPLEEPTPAPAPLPQEPIPETDTEPTIPEPQTPPEEDTLLFDDEPAPETEAEQGSTERTPVAPQEGGGTTTNCDLFGSQNDPECGNTDPVPPGGGGGPGPTTPTEPEPTTPTEPTPTPLPGDPGTDTATDTAPLGSAEQGLTEQPLDCEAQGLEEDDEGNCVAPEPELDCGAQGMEEEDGQCVLPEPEVEEQAPLEELVPQEPEFVEPEVIEPEFEEPEFEEPEQEQEQEQEQQQDFEEPSDGGEESE